MREVFSWPLRQWKTSRVVVKAVTAVVSLSRTGPEWSIPTPGLAWLLFPPSSKLVLVIKYFHNSLIRPDNIFISISSLPQRVSWPSQCNKVTTSIRLRLTKIPGLQVLRVLHSWQISPASAVTFLARAILSIIFSNNCLVEMINDLQCWF